MGEISTGEFYDIVPKGTIENIRYRQWVCKRAQRDRAFQKEEWIKCSRDLLYWCNTYVFTYNPKDKNTKYKVLPFITYPFQDDSLTTLVDAVGNHDVCIEKSRDMGASWMCVLVFVWFWQFHEWMSFLMISRTEKLVDFGEDPRSLFWKARFIIEGQPKWLQPNYKDNKLRLHNRDTNSTIDGESTTKDAGRGDRRTAGLIDEYAAFEYQDGYKVKSSTADVSDCWFYNSTPQGTTGAFYDIVRNSFITKLRLHWSEHPVKSRGLYTTNTQGNIEIMDVDYDFGENYEFVFDKVGKPRSPWYDYEVMRRDSKQEVGQELDIDYLGSDYTFFEIDTIEALIQEHCRKPSFQGDLDYIIETLEPTELRRHSRGKLRMWDNLPPEGKPDPQRLYVIGIDIAAGSGASNSVATVIDKISGRKVAEYADPNITPENFARKVIAFGKFWNNAYLIWERNGPGGPFGIIIMQNGYNRGKIYSMTEQNTTDKKKSRKFGWFSTTETKLTLLTEYRMALNDGTFVNPSKEGMDECKKYLHVDGGRVEHIGSLKNDNDPTGAAANHGDRVIADALAIKGCQFVKHIRKEVEKFPANCLAARNKLHDDLNKKNKDTWFDGNSIRRRKRLVS